MAILHLAANPVYEIASWRCRNPAARSKVNLVALHARGTTANVERLELACLVGEMRLRISGKGTWSTWELREVHAEGANLVGQGIAAAQLRKLHPSRAAEKLRG